MAHQQSFRCPFEVKGEKDGTILEVVLGENREERIARVSEAFVRFSKIPESPAIRFRLEPALWNGCTSLRALRSWMVPFQSEVLAGELDFRLAPLLPYQFKSADAAHVREVHKKDPYRLWIAYALTEAIDASVGMTPTCAGDIASWIEQRFRDGHAKRLTNPNIQIMGSVSGVEDTCPRFHLFTISPSAVEFLHETQTGSLDPSVNRNCFSIVKAPWYPKEFGRYSDGVEVVVTRKADVNALSESAVRAIRASSNKVLKRAGVKVQDVECDQQETGVWVPKFKYR